MLFCSEKDITLIQAAISAEYLRIQKEDPKFFKSSSFNAHMQSYKQGLWDGHEQIGALYSYENVAYNMKATADPDHWC